MPCSRSLSVVTLVSKRFPTPLPASTPPARGPSRLWRAEMIYFLEVRPLLFHVLTVPCMHIPCFKKWFIHPAWLIVSSLRAGAMPSLSITLPGPGLATQCVPYKCPQNKLMAACKFPSQPVTSLLRLQMFHSAKTIHLSIVLALPLSCLQIPPSTSTQQSGHLPSSPPGDIAPSRLSFHWTWPF